MKKLKYILGNVVSISMLMIAAACSDFDATPGLTRGTDRVLDALTVEGVAEAPAETIDFTVRANFNDGMSVRVTNAAVIKVNGAIVESPWAPVPVSTFNVEAKYEGKTATSAIHVESVSIDITDEEIKTADVVDINAVVTFDNGMSIRANNTATFTANGQPITNPWIPVEGGDFEIVASFGAVTATTNVTVEWGLIPVQFNLTSGLVDAFGTNANGLRNGSLVTDSNTGDRVITIPNLYRLAEGKTGNGSEATTPHTFVDHTAEIRIHPNNSVTFARINVLSVYRIGDVNYLSWDVLQNGNATYDPGTKTLSIPVKGNLNYYGTYQWGSGVDQLVLTFGVIPQ